MSEDQQEEFRQLRNKYLFGRSRDDMTRMYGEVIVLPMDRLRISELSLIYIKHLRNGGEPLFEIISHLSRKLELPSEIRWEVRQLGYKY